MNNCKLAGTTDGLAELFRRESWNRTGFAAIDAAKNADGKYTSGTFVGDKSSFESRVADGYKITGGSGTYGIWTVANG